MGLHTPRKAVVAEGRITSEPEEMTILSYTVPPHHRKGMTALAIKPKAPYGTHFLSGHASRVVCKLLDVGRSATWPRDHYSGHFLARQIYNINRNEDTSDARLEAMRCDSWT
jgi:hypothetical protein